MDKTANEGENSQFNVELIVHKSNNEAVNTYEETTNDIDSIQDMDKKYYKNIILDCSSIQFVDETGAKCLRDLIGDYQKENVTFLLTNCNGFYFVIFYFDLMMINLSYLFTKYNSERVGVFQKNGLLL